MPPDYHSFYEIRTDKLGSYNTQIRDLFPTQISYTVKQLPVYFSLNLSLNRDEKC